MSAHDALVYMVSVSLGLSLIIFGYLFMIEVLQNGH